MDKIWCWSSAMRILKITLFFIHCWSIWNGSSHLRFSFTADNMGTKKKDERWNILQELRCYVSLIALTFLVLVSLWLVKPLNNSKLFKSIVDQFNGIVNWNLHFWKWKASSLTLKILKLGIIHYQLNWRLPS